MFEHDVSNVGVSNAKAEASVGDYLKRLLARVTGPMPVVGGSTGLPSREGMPGRKAPSDDPVLLEKTAHVRKSKETMMQFFSRIGLGPGRIRTMSKAEISRFCEVVMSNPDYQRARRGDSDDV